jgi:hypothetical protein
MADRMDIWENVRGAQGAPAPSPSNPFASALGMGGGGGGGPDYSSLFDPEAGGLTGLIGRAAGMPTREEDYQRQQGAMRGPALQAMTQRLEQGMSPQQAVIDFVRTPEGQEFFMQGEDAMGQIREFMQLAVAPPEEGVALSPGQKLVGQQSGREMASVPPTEIQVNEALFEIGGLSPEEQALVARGQLAKSTTGDFSAEEDAWNRLISTGRASRETADLSLSGALQLVPLYDQAGKQYGQGVWDKTQQRMVQVGDTPITAPQPGEEGFADGITEGARPEDKAQVNIQELYRGMEDPADIVEGAGIVPAFGEILGGIAGQVLPGLESAQTKQKRNALAAIRADVQRLRGVQEGRGFSADVGMLDRLGNTLGVSTSMKGATQTLLTLHDYLDQRAGAALSEERNPKTTAEVRGGAAQEGAVIRQMKKNLPPRANLVAKLAELESAEARGAIPQAVEQLPGTVGEAVQGVEQETERVLGDGKTFATEAEASAAKRAGKLKSGDTITIGGRKAKVN